MLHCGKNSNYCPLCRPKSEKKAEDLGEKELQKAVDEIRKRHENEML